MLLADLEEALRRVKWVGVRLAGKVYSLSYTDDIVLLKKDEKGMRSMIGILEECLEGKGLELNTNKRR